MKLAVTSCAVSAAAPARAAIVAEAIAVGFLPPHRGGSGIDAPTVRFSLVP